jgi:hypothetical protein
MRRIPAAKLEVKKIFWIFLLTLAVSLIMIYKNTRIISPVPPDSGIRVIILEPTLAPTGISNPRVPVGGAPIP